MEESKSDLNGNEMKGPFQNLWLRALLQYTRGIERDKLVIGFDE